MKKKIMMVIASNGYHQVEFNIPYTIFNDSGFDVTVCSDKAGNAIAKDGSPFKVGLTIAEAKMTNYTALVLVGGPGALECLDNEESYALIQDAMKEGCTIAAICISPRIIATAGGLVGVQATGWDDDGELQALFDKHGAYYLKEPVVTDGNRVTAQGPKDAEAFAEAIKAIL
jgi:protease I